jgi:hypothetical protein
MRRNVINWISVTQDSKRWRSYENTKYILTFLTYYSWDIISFSSDFSNYRVLSYGMTNSLNSQFFHATLSCWYRQTDRRLHNYKQATTALFVINVNRPHALSTVQLTKNYLTCQNVISSLVLGPRAILSLYRRETTGAAHKTKEKLCHLETFLCCFIIIIVLFASTRRLLTNLCTKFRAVILLTHVVMVK